MGDRISISFKNGSEQSVALFSHWGGRGLLASATVYTFALKQALKELGNPQTYSIQRLEPGTVMIDFIRHLTKDLLRVESDLYLGKDENDGDNSDNGHWIIDLETGRIA